MVPTQEPLGIITAGH